MYSCSYRPKDEYEWPKDVGSYYVIKLHSCTQLHLLVFLKKCIHLINAWNMECIKLSGC